MEFHRAQKFVQTFKQICFIILLGVSINMKFSSVHAQNNVLIFDGINDYVNLDAVTPTLVGSPSYTIELWMKADRFAQTLLRPILFSINKSATFNINAQNILLITFGNSTITDGLLSMSTVASGAGVNSGINVGDTLCHHIAYVNSGIGSNSGLLYIDGVLVLSNLATPPALTSTDRISLGQEFDGATPSQFYKGELDNVRIWTAIRTQAEIQANMNLQLTGTETNLIALYQFNQGVAGGNNTAITNLVDLNLPSNNGVLLNFNLNNSISNFISSSCVTCVTQYSAENVSSCESETVTFPDGSTQVIFSNTSYISNLLTSSGCDSLVTTNVQMLLNTFGSNQDSICSGSDYTFPDGTTHFDIIAEEVYVSSLINSIGCDSLVTTTINLLPINPTIENVQICYNTDYTYPDGTVHTNITNNENYTSEFNTVLGCDSIVITFVTVFPQILTIQNMDVCSGSNYTFPDGTIHSNIVTNESYNSTFTSTTGCDSLVQTNLNIIVISMSNENVSTCLNSDYTFPDGVTHFNITSPENYVSTLSSIEGCDSLVNTSLNILFPPQPHLGPDIQKCDGKFIVLNVSEPLSTYLWNTGETTSSISISNPGLYSAAVTNICGTETSTIEIIDIDCNCTLYFPNSFTPNSDEFNQTFGPKYDCQIDKYKLEIYNRWGELIYLSENIDIPWDGNYRGRVSPEGEYTYKVTFSYDVEINKVITGHVNLLR